MKELEWSESSLEDMAALDKDIARRIQRTVERFAKTEIGNIKRLQGIDPPEYGLRVGDWRVRFVAQGGTALILRVLNRKDAYRSWFRSVATFTATLAVLQAHSYRRVPELWSLHHSLLFRGLHNRYRLTSHHLDHQFLQRELASTHHVL